MDYLSSQIDNDIILIAQIVHLQFTYLLLCLYIFIVMYVAFWVFCLTVLFCLLFVCKCVLYCCQRVTTHLLLKNISYHIIKRKIYWKSVFFFCYKFFVFFFFFWSVSFTKLAAKVCTAKPSIFGTIRAVPSPSPPYIKMYVSVHERGRKRQAALMFTGKFWNVAFCK